MILVYGALLVSSLLLSIKCFVTFANNCKKAQDLLPMDFISLLWTPTVAREYEERLHRLDDEERKELFRLKSSNLIHAMCMIFAFFLSIVMFIVFWGALYRYAH